MGYKTEAAIPVYWTYARRFVLQDRIFEGVRSISPDSIADLISQWTAACTDANDVATCTTTPQFTGSQYTGAAEWPWASLLQLFDVHGVSWKYCLGFGPEPDCSESPDQTCSPQLQATGVAGGHNAPPHFKWVKQQDKAYLPFHNPMIDQFLMDLSLGTLPQVSWIIPSEQFSDHPPASTDGFSFAARLRPPEGRASRSSDTELRELCPLHGGPVRERRAA